MKKTFLIICIISASITGNLIFAQGKVNKNEKSEKTLVSTPDIKAIEDLALAHNLASYGRRTFSVEALITAIRIVANTPTIKLEFVKTSDNIDSIKVELGTKPTSTNLSDITLSGLVNDARKMANGDKALLDIIDKILKEADIRGVIGGPKYINERILSRSQDNYIVPFEGSEYAVVYVSGDGSTDLDLFVYDENGNLIVSDDDYTDECFIRFIPKWTGKFKIIVKNKGYFYNDYVLKTN